MPSIIMMVERQLVDSICVDSPHELTARPNSLHEHQRPQSHGPQTLALRTTHHRSSHHLSPTPKHPSHTQRCQCRYTSTNVHWRLMSTRITHNTMLRVRAENFDGSTLSRTSTSAHLPSANPILCFRPKIRETGRWCEFWKARDAGDFGGTRMGEGSRHRAD